MRQGSGGQRGTPRKRHSRGDRVQRPNPPDQPSDIGSEIEDELAASGRTSHVPREGLVGAHEGRRSPASETADPDDRPIEPAARGADVAPTRKAELREAKRHQLERQLGRVPAGAGKTLRQRRGPHASREALDRVAAEADDIIARRHLDSGGHAGTLQDRAWSWLSRHRTEVAIGVGSVILAAGCLGAASILRRSR